MIPLSACPANLAPKVVKVGAGPDNTMLAPSAILSTSLGFLRNNAPPLSLFLLNNTVFPQPVGPEIITLVGVLNVKASLLSMTTHSFKVTNFYFNLTLITTNRVDRI